MTLSFVPLAWLVWAWAPSFAAGGLPSPSPPERVDVIRGVSRGLGTRLAAAGDGNGDGYDDLLVAAGGCDTCEGAFWFPGGPDGPLPASGVQLAEPSDSHFDFGLDVAGAGDLDADGYDDVAVGSWASGVSVFHGGPDGPDPKPWATLVQDRAWIVTGPGDVDGDGYDDLAIGNQADGGTVWLYTGSADGPDPDRWVVVAGVCKGELGGLGDIDGDGFADLLTADSHDDYVVHGAATPPGRVDRLHPSVEPHSDEWPALSGAGDVDGDGYLDLASSRRVSGVSVFTGGTDGFAQDPTFVLDDALPGVYYGVALDLGGDMDADGLSEMVVGAGWDPDQEGGASPGPN